MIIAARSKFFKRMEEKFKCNVNVICIDSSASMERFNLPVFILSHPTQYGPMPVAFVIVSDETEDTMKTAFSAVKKMGIEMKFAMTDDCTALRNAIQHTWPLAKLLLCTWHFSQAYWTWLLDKRHGFNESNRQEVHNKFMTLLYAEKERHNELISELQLNYAQKPKFISKLENDLQRIDQWSIAYRSNYF